MRWGARLVGASLVVAAAAAMHLAGSAAGQGLDPTVSVDRTGTAAGEQMLVSGGGWPAGATVVVELCGRGGIGGTVDCDVSQQRIAGVGSSGTFSVQLTSSKPPSPCPCVVKATEQSSQVAATAPIAVAGVPTVPLTPEAPSPPSVEISSITLSGGGRWTELFGAGGRRVLEITLVNTGPTPVPAPEVTLAWGRGTDPDGFVEPPDTVPMEPGATQILTVALDRPALTIGQQTAVVEIAGAGDDVVARVSTTAHPWGLLVVALIAIQVLLLRIRNRVRRRLVGTPDESEGDSSPDEPLALAAAPAALPPGEGPLETDVDPAVGPHAILGAAVIDLDAPAAPSSPSSQPTPNGHRPTPVVAVAAAHELDADLLRLRLDSSRALQDAIARSEAIVTATVERVSELQAQAEQHLLDAARRRAEAAEVLAAARLRADALAAGAAAVAEATLREAALDREHAHQIRTQIETSHRNHIGEVMEQVASRLDELDQRAATLRERLHAAQDAATPADEPEPRADALDRQMASALERAIADVTHPASEPR